MKSVSDYIKTLVEDAVPVNTVSSGAIASKDVPLGAVKKRKDVKEDVLDEAKKDIATYKSAAGVVVGKVIHNTKSGKYLVKHFLNGSHHHGHDSTHDSEDDAREAIESKINQKSLKRESVAYEGDNPLGDAVGKFPLASGATAPDIENTEADKEKHLFKQKQVQTQNT